MRRLVLCALVAAGCGKSLGPRDVELTINTRPSAINGGATVNDADLASVHALELTLSGSESDHTRYDLSRAFLRTEKVIIHLQKSTGTLTIGALARDGQNLVVGIGSTTATLHDSNPQILDVDLAPPPDGTHAQSAVSLTPDTAQLFTGQTVPFTSASSVSWSVMSGGAGGTVDDKGVYTAPAVAGSDTIVAESAIYFGEQRSAKVDVLESGILRYAGLTAGAGTIDGTGAAARIAYPRGLAFDGAGSAFFGDNGSVIRKLDLGSGAVTTLAGTIENNVWADGTGAAAGFTGPWRVVYDSTRKVLYAADNNTIRKVVVATGAVSTLAGTDGMYQSVDGTGPAAFFESAMGLAYDGQDHLYVADNQADNIREVDVSTGVVTTIAGVASMPGYMDGPGASALFDYPAVLALDGKGALFVGDSHNQLIRKIDLGSKMVSTVAGKLGINGNQDGPLGTGTIGYPEVLAYDGMGTLYTGGRKIDVATGTITTLVNGTPWYPVTELDFAPDGKLWAATMSGIASADPANFVLSFVAGVPISYNDLDHVDGARSAARFNGSTGICTAADGTLLFRDGVGVRRIDLGKETVKTLFTANEYMGGPQNLTVADDGTIYMAWNSSLYSLSPSEGYNNRHTLTSTTFGYADGALAQAKFSCPQDLVAVGKMLYVADSCNNVIRAVDLQAGMVSTLAGTVNMGGLVDMPGAAARFNFPQGITADGAGNLYVASNHAVRKIVIAGADVSTVAGGDTAGYADGTGSAAKFHTPIRLALDAAKQNLYVADVKNTAIRKVALAGGVVTTVAGAPGKAVVTPGALPGAVNEPGALTVAPSGDLFVVVPHEESVLQIRLP